MLNPFIFSRMRSTSENLNIFSARDKGIYDTVCTKRFFKKHFQLRRFADVYLLGLIGTSQNYSNPQKTFCLAEIADLIPSLPILYDSDF